ncbi:MAG: 2-dehydropantoate 2-reductase N-terminal domain-containing protein [Bacteroidales bacterium]|jgi:glycerol-3-phosphate dehydrogenase (NAD(P)+)|nr:2-dehydropantoate 2-reductase N-terminal domain-containing protein [Bacteroidales bacterium]
MAELKSEEVVFIGSGAIATSLGNILAKNGVQVMLISIEDEVVQRINEAHINPKYFNSFRLNPALKASVDKSVLKTAGIIFLAIPSNAVVDYVKTNVDFINPKAVIVNLAKGFGSNSAIIPDCLSKILDNPIVSMKGPSFAREILNDQPTAFTIASNDQTTFRLFEKLFEKSTIYLDFTTDIRGVEYASILKNIYAIIIGIVDASFDSPNLRSMVLSKAINEMRNLMIGFGGQSQTIFNYCGFGDFSLTALNDLSRNRTLGLLIGKGFFSQDISQKVVLEGRIAVNIFYERLKTKDISEQEYPLLSELYKVFNTTYDIGKFVSNILKIHKPY